MADGVIRIGGLRPLVGGGSAGRVIAPVSRPMGSVRKRQCGEPAEGRQVVNASNLTNRIESIGVAAGARPINAVV
jgi:hypothetical protein